VADGGGDNLFKLNSPNLDAEEEDKEFDDCDKEGQGVPDENNNLELVKGLNPKSQLTNSLASRANRYNQLEQPCGDSNLKAISDNTPS